MEIIQSLQNKRIKEIRKLKQKKYREQTGQYKIEGPHLIEEAKQANKNIALLVYTEKAFQENEELIKIITADEKILVSEDVLKSISDLPTPQGLLAVLSMDSMKQPKELKGPLLLLDRVQDPGNLGTMIRTADAAAYQGVVLGKGCADLYNDKVQQALQGSHFHLPIWQADLCILLPQLEKAQIAIYGTELNDEAMVYNDVAPTNNLALLMGNEGQGVAQDLLKLTTQNLYIPISGQAESLNVAVATGILIFHFNS